MLDRNQAQKIAYLEKDADNLSFDKNFQQLCDLIQRGDKRITVGGLESAAKAFLLAALFRRLDKPLVVISPTEKEAHTFHQDLSFFLVKEHLFFYPPWDVHSTDMFAIQQETACERTEILCRLYRKEKAVFVLPLQALMEKVLPIRDLADYAETISLGDCRDREQLVEKLLAGGYRRVSLVERCGEFAVRGNVLDIFPPAVENPLRLEFLGDELESIRAFHTDSQRSAGELCDFTLFPAGEMILSAARRQLAVTNIRRRANELGLSVLLKNRLLEAVANGLSTSINPLFLPLFYEAGGEGNNNEGEQLGTFFDYLTSEIPLVIDDFLAWPRVEQEIENKLDHLILKAQSEESFYLEKRSSYLTGEEMLRRGEAHAQIYMGGAGPGDKDVRDGAASPEVKFAAGKNLLPREAWKRHTVADAGPLGFLVDHLRKNLAEGFLTVFLCPGHEEVQRMTHLLVQHGLEVGHDHGPASFWNELERRDGRGRVVLLDGKLSGGFQFPDWKLALFTEEELFGRKISRRKSRPLREGYFLQSFGDLNDGDAVVHTDHGIGRYRGLQKLVVGGLENDFLLLEYQGGDRLYIPVYRLDVLQRYIGAGDYQPPLDKLGGTSWETVKAKVKKSVREMAEELAAIYGARQVLGGYAFSRPGGIYDEFCAGFEYEETPDQAKAIEEMAADLADAKPMDRLICGDAGFGKTEVAIRASFLAAMEGKQVAVLVPTTVLAEQHYQTFSRRFKDWPIRVEVINRFKTKAELQKIVADLKQGTVDVVIGTHRLLQKDVAFKDLGLVVIDEEQQFGVAHKERLKKFRTEVDVLTMTATPIPRTLHLSLVGLRDLTVINTPPEDRLPIKSYLLEFDEEIIKEAIREELARGGQVFFLHDRVRSIYTMSRFVEKLVPEARVGIVHGRMKAVEIEEVMTAFVRGDRDVLVCTTIIGAGLDIPSANTILINRADRFGLAQLYQIKGRVGRAKEEGRAYFLIPKGMMLSREAGRRLQAIMDFSEHGSGFRVSYQDLEIRGGGNILGASQSGHISAVGYELYTELMEQTVREIKGQEVPVAEQKPEIHLGVEAFIPEEYMPDVRRRLIAYKRLSMAETEAELATIREELIDCYGFVPPQVSNLLEVLGIKNLLQNLRGKKMVYDKKNMVVSFRRESRVEPARILQLAREKWPAMRLTPDLQLHLPLPDLKEADILGEAKRLLQLLNAEQPPGAATLPSKLPV